MRPRSQTLFPLGVLTLLAALTFWLQYAIQPPEAARDGKNRHDPDFIIQNFTLKRFDQKGELQHTLTAEKMVHFPDDDSTVVTHPYVIFTGREEPTRVRANQALVSADGEEVVLVGDVLVTREGSAQREEMSLATSVLTVYPDDEISRTTAPVTLRRGKSVVNGVGLEANNITGIASLHSQVRGVIEPKKATQ